MNRFKKPAKRALLGVVLIVSLLTTGVGVFVWSAPWWLEGEEDAPIQVDCLVVLGGDQTRAEWAAQLYQKKVSSRILVSGRGDVYLNQSILLAGGVPGHAISLEPLSASTIENARFSGSILGAVGAKRIGVVTGWYHSPRALATFRHELPGFQFVSLPVARAGKLTQGEIRGARLEMLKRLVYFVRFGVPLGR